MEVATLKGAWYHIAKAEFLVITSRIRERRSTSLLGLLTFGVVWALIIVPFIISRLLHWLGSETSVILMTGLPGFMRSFVLFL